MITQIEKVLRDYLETALDVPVFLELPEVPPSSFVLIEKTGGSMLNQIWHSTFAIQSVAHRLSDASALMDRAIDAMLHIIDTLDISASTLTAGSYNFTDPDTKLHRYQSVFELTY